MADLDEINGIVGKARTTTERGEILLDATAASNAINAVYIPKRDIKNNLRPPEFSFYKCLEDNGVKVTKYKRGINQVVSTMYAALVKTGINLKDIDIVADLDGYAYYPNVKRIKVTGSMVDFKFRNNTDSPLIIMSQVKDDGVEVYFLGKTNETDKN
jgi:hypothetical protein